MMSFRGFIVSFVVVGAALWATPALADGVEEQDSTLAVAVAGEPADSLAAATAAPAKRHPWLAAAEVGAMNMGLLGVDRFIINGAYARVTMHTIRRNLEMTHWWWDVDVFRTNLFGHPYHGNLYFNAARSCGMNFWASSLYSVGGSLMWELAGENELPSINDFLATSLGGAAIGEVAFRLSDLVIDERQRGPRRFMAELAAAAINPLRGLNRVLTGDAWRVRPQRSGGAHGVAVEGCVSAGVRQVRLGGNDDGRLTAPYVSFDMEYGDLTEQGRSKPFDYFRTGLTLTATGGQDLVNDLRITARLLQWPLQENKRMASALALFQHFSYYGSEAPDGGILPYKLSEAVSLGPGLAFSFPRLFPAVALRQAFFANAVVLGGSGDDYPGRPIYRDYSFGSGFNLKWSAQLSVGNWGRLWLDAEDHHLYTWVGYDGMERDHRTHAQGHRKHGEVLLVRSVGEVNMKCGLGLRLGATFFRRNNRYAVLEDQRHDAWELRAGLLWRL